MLTLVQRYVFSKLEVSTAFMLRKIGGTGWTDRQSGRQTYGVQRLMRLLSEGRIIIWR